MDAAYSPVNPYGGPLAQSQHRRNSQDFQPEPSPPLVPVPERDPRAQGYHNHDSNPYDRPPAPPSEGSVPPGPGSAPPYPPRYPDDRYYGGAPPPPHEDPYAAHYGAPPRRPDYPDYPPAHGYPYGRPPPPPADYYYGRPPPPGPGYPPRDPYGYPPRDPYGGGGYPPRDPYYGGAPPPPPPPGARDPYARDPYGSVPPPPPPPASAGLPVPSGPAVGPGSVAQYGPPPDPKDLSIPLLYLARSVNLKTFTPLKGNYPNLDLRFVLSLRDLGADMAVTALEHPNLLGHRRRVWVTAVGGTDALVHRTRASMTEVLDWREAGDLQELERELAIEDRRVVVVREEMAEEARRREREESERRDRESRQAEVEKGRREIEARESERERDGGAAAVAGESQDLEDVLRQVRGGGNTPAPAVGASSNGTSETLPGRNGCAAPELVPSRVDSRHPGDGAAVVDRFEEQARRDSEAGESPERSKKRSRRESEGVVADDERERRRASRKKLEAVCKSERRRCVDWALQHGIPVTEETRQVDDEPQLGERHKGVWDLFGQPLEEVSPQIQVLMARAMRDSTFPPHLRLYDTPDALDQLQQAVPWFVSLVNGIQDRYELAASAAAAASAPSQPRATYGADGTDEAYAPQAANEDVPIA
ncbi:hypothetical protein JCM8547_004592 [Rhodosporidiobolus lusitaniae]